MRLRLPAILSFVIAAGCTSPPADPYADHDEPSDYDPATGDGKADGLASFDQNDVYSDAFLTDETAIDAIGLQAFFESSPYGTRSWLADATLDGASAAETIVEAAAAEHLNPLVLVARMQVESSLVSKTATPTQRKQNQALGCGCPDGGGCSAAFAGLHAQLACGAHVMRRWFDASNAGTGEYRVGHATRTLDPKTVTPATSATAALYAYTPWVLVGRGGTWLVWNVTKKYVQHAVAHGWMAPLTTD